MTAVAGIDIGSVTAKTVILTEVRQMLAFSIIKEGLVSEEAALASLRMALDKAGLKRDELGTIITTGYGRSLISFSSRSITEISCHAIGAHFILPEVRTIIDIGGQDTKVIAVDPAGRVEAFQMNDKCAAGTGRFLEVMSRALQVPLEDMNDLAARSSQPCQVSSLCTVFAESEIISLVARGASKSDIIAGLYESISRRTLSLLNSIGVRPTVVMTGGVAKNRQLVLALERAINCSIFVPEEPQIVGALGAALFALR